MLVRAKKRNELSKEREEISRIREIIRARLSPDSIKSMKTEKDSSRRRNTARLNGFTSEQLKTQFNM